MTDREWSFGDKVVHGSKPEWGIGLVTGASGMTHEGQPCQRVVIRFERAGVKTLSTAIADLRPASDLPSLALADQADELLRSEPTLPSQDNPGWLEKAAAPNAVDIMTRLPDQTNDPFTPLSARLKATIDLYRFTDSGSSLLDWAAAQSGLKDPLSRFSRHELEQQFRRFCFARDEHLKRTVLELKKQDAPLLQQILKAAPAPVQQALKRLDVGR